MAFEPPLSVNGWTILFHPLFVDQLAAIVADVQRAKAKDPSGYRAKNSAKRLKAILKLTCADVPANPASPAYRLGSTLGPEYGHWFRAKFFQQYRLFFRFDAKQRIIVYAWVNDDRTKRAYGSGTDAYAVFFGMLTAGNPPNGWAQLLCACQDARRALAQAAGSIEGE